VDPLEAFAALAPSRGANPWRGMRFTTFCTRIGVTLLPGQLAFCLVAYDGLEPRDLPEELRAVARQIFGPVDVIPKEARRVICIVAGARGGKSYVFGALRALHLALTVPLDSLAPGEEAFAVIISADPRQRAQCYGYARGAAEATPDIKRLIVGEPGTESFTIGRPDGRVTIESLPAKRGGGSGRGRSLVCAVLEECAFFQDADHVVNDEDVFKAVTPRVLPGGQTVLSSTPWAETGLLYDEFIANHPDPSCAAPHLTQAGHPHRAIAAHAPTLLLRDVKLTREIVDAESHRDPENAAREYGAQFLSVGTSSFFDAIKIAEAVDHELIRGAPSVSDPVAVVRSFGVDLGFVRDAATGVAVERDAEGYAALDWVEVIPSVERLKPSEVLARLAAKADEYEITDAVADQHYIETAREAFWGRPELPGAARISLTDLPGGQPGKAEVFKTARDILHEGNLRVPNDARLLQQLREVKKRPLPGGGMAIEMPRKPKGGHGDIVSGLVAAVWRLSKMSVPKPADKRTPDEQRNDRWARRAERMKRNEQQREWERGIGWDG
jgi:hypothetical protein